MVVDRVFLFFLVIFLFFCKSSIYSQQYIVKGKLINQDQQFVEFMQVSLVKMDTIYLSETVTDSLGRFQFESEAGEYFLVMEQYGVQYLKKSVSLYQDLDFGEIEIDETTALNEITITAPKKRIERKVDRLVFKVENTAQSSGSTVFDLLKIAPRVKVQNDQISMIGKSSMKIMIDNQTVQLTGMDLTNFLNTMRSDDIKDIEIITNPPAKYSAEGNSGLINIITKKSNEEMWNSSIQTSIQQRSYGTATAGGSFNYKKDKLTLKLNANYTDGSTAPIENNTIEYSDFTWKENSNGRNFSTLYGFNLGVDYQISSKLSLGLNYRYSPSDKEIISNQTSNIINAKTNRVDSIIKTPSVQWDKVKLQTVNTNFIYHIDKMKKKLTFDFDYFSYNSDSNSFFNSNTYDGVDLSKPLSTSLGNNSGNQLIDNYSLSLDMEHPINWASFNYGVRFYNIETNSSYLYNDTTAGIATAQPNQSNHFIYKENTEAVYFSIHKEWSSKWESKVGFRLENTNTTGNSLTLNEQNKVNYTKLFPTAYISYTPNDNHAFSWSYSRRISRPNYKLLNPFRWVGSPYYYIEGNPYLQPAFTDNVEFEYVFKENFISSLYFSYTDNDFEQLTIVDLETTTQKVVPQNFIINKMLGFNQMIVVKPFNWWNSNLFGTVYYSYTDSKIPVTLQYLKGWNGEFSLDNDFALNSSNTLFFNIRYSFITKGVSNLDHNTAFDQLNASFKGTFYDKKLTVSLRANDLLSSNRVTYTGYSNGVKNSFTNYFDSRYVVLSATYNIGRKFKTNSRENKNKVEQDRIN